MKSSNRTIVVFVLILIVCTTSALSDSVRWISLKRANSYSISIWIDVPDANEIYIKGPQMADYEIVNIEEGTDGLGWRMENLTLADLNTHSQGTWLLKVTFDTLPESVNSFGITGGVSDSEFPPLPTILYPSEGDTDIIAENCSFSWNPNGAESSGAFLSVDTEGDNFYYTDNSFSGQIPSSATMWDPGWLEQGPAFMKMGYWFVMWPKRTLITHVSGTEINWDVNTPIPLWMSGDRVEFEVTRTIDLNDDDIINLSDLSVMMANWLEQK